MFSLFIHFAATSMSKRESCRRWVATVHRERDRINEQKNNLIVREVDVIQLHFYIHSISPTTTTITTMTMATETNEKKIKIKYSKWLNAILLLVLVIAAAAAAALPTFAFSALVDVNFAGSFSFVLVGYTYFSLVVFDINTSNVWYICTYINNENRKKKNEHTMKCANGTRPTGSGNSRH